jgi:hypothetical protein
MESRGVPCPRRVCAAEKGGSGARRVGGSSTRAGRSNPICIQQNEEGWLTRSREGREGGTGREWSQCSHWPWRLLQARDAGAKNHQARARKRPGSSLGCSGRPLPRAGAAARRKGEAERGPATGLRTGESAGHRLGLADEILFVSNNRLGGCHIASRKTDPRLGVEAIVTEQPAVCPEAIANSPQPPLPPRCGHGQPHDGRAKGTTSQMVRLRWADPAAPRLVANTQTPLRAMLTRPANAS